MATSNKYDANPSFVMTLIILISCLINIPPKSIILCSPKHSTYLSLACIGKILCLRLIHKPCILSIIFLSWASIVKLFNILTRCIMYWITVGCYILFIATVIVLNSFLPSFVLFATLLLIREIIFCNFSKNMMD